MHLYNLEGPSSILSTPLHFLLDSLDSIRLSTAAICVVRLRVSPESQVVDKVGEVEAGCGKVGTAVGQGWDGATTSMSRSIKRAVCRRRGQALNARQ